jgi:hypothetical protein
MILIFAAPPRAVALKRSPSSAPPRAVAIVCAAPRASLYMGERAAVA